LSSWFNGNWLVALATGLNSLLVGRQVRAGSRRNEFDILQTASARLRDRMTPRAPSDAETPLYALRHKFVEAQGASGPVPITPTWGHHGYQQNLLLRIAKVQALSREDREAAMDAVEKATNALTDVAELIEFGMLDRRKVLAKYHLSFIREVYILEPFIICGVLFWGRGPRWGMRALRLGEMARQYNDMNPIHRRSVYFSLSGVNDRAFGAVYPAPNSSFLRLWRAWWWLRRHTVGYPTLSQRSKRSQNTYMHALEESTKHLR
jgi:hypothetical protein